MEKNYQSFLYFVLKIICTTAHVLGACKIALSQGRFTFRHDLVLSVLSSSLLSFLEHHHVYKKEVKPYIKFVKADEKIKKRRTNHTGLLNLAPDWKLLSNLNTKLVFPSFIAITTLRPDMVLYSISTKTVFIVELLCPCEENMEEWYRVKFEKYEPLTS